MKKLEDAKAKSERYFLLGLPPATKDFITREFTKRQRFKSNKMKRELEDPVKGDYKGEVNLTLVVHSSNFQPQAGRVRGNHYSELKEVMDEGRQAMGLPAIDLVIPA